MQVFTALVQQKKIVPPKTTKTIEFRNLIKKYMEEYCQLSDYVPVELKYSQQIAAYECTKINTAYANAIALQFGSRFRMFVNQLTRQKERVKSRKQELQKEKRTEQDISNIIYNEITQPCTRLKLLLASGNIHNLPTGFLDNEGIARLQEFFGTYGSEYQFKKGSIYYDCKAEPFNHLKAYYKMSQICEQSDYKSFMCFPLRKSYVPCYMTIDTMILNNQIVQNSQRSKLDKTLVWGKVVNISCRALKDRGQSKSMQFRGMILVIKQNQETAKGGTRGIHAKDEEDVQYIHELTTKELQDTTGKCVFIDPGRRDMLYCMHEKCKAKNDGSLYRYTSNQRAKETKSREFTKLRHDTKPEVVQKWEERLSKHSASTVDVTKFSEYLKARSMAHESLSSYYRNEDKAQRDQNALPFRKMKLSSIINRKQSDSRLAKTLRGKFGEDPVLVIGDWSAGNVKFHEPIRGKGMRKMLKKHGFPVYLINEHKTSSLCPNCKDGKLKNFLNVPNPRPFQRKKRPVVKCHGLLRCTNQKCLEPTRLWNRDFAAVLNSKEIMNSHRLALDRPLRFQRQTLKRPSTGKDTSQNKKFRSMPPEDGRNSV